MVITLNKHSNKKSSGNINTIFKNEMITKNIGMFSNNNRISLVADGNTYFDELEKAITRAQKRINLETYIFNSDHTGWHIASLLAQKAKEGIEINIIFDAIGCIKTSPKLFGFLKKSGINVFIFNELLPWKQSLRISWRNHRKVMIIDGNMALMGGFNIGNEYAGKPLHGNSWRDTHLKIYGSAAIQLEDLFYSTLNKIRHIENPIGNSATDRIGSKEIIIIPADRYDRTRPLEQALLTAIDSAEKNIKLTYGYFLPTPILDSAIIKAAERGIKIEILMPNEIDIPYAKYAFMHCYKKYMEKGIDIYEYQNAILHAKNAVIDGSWSTIGSANFDRRSLYKNLEVNAVILDPLFGNKMEEMFNDDLQFSKKIELAEWHKRPLYHPVIEWTCYRFRDHL